MIEITQTAHFPRGNCYAACIASIFHLDLAKLPALPEDDTIISAKFPVDPKYYGIEESRNLWWHDMWSTWKKENNLLSIAIRASLLGEYDRSNLLCWHICNGPSPRDPEQTKSDGRGMKHSVVGYKGLIRFDPHPSRAGLMAIDSYELIVPVDITKPILEGYRA